jgi:tetratricopeptide (TPR) repeat protein
MDNKVSSSLERALQDKKKGNYHKALKRLTETLEKFPDEVELYLESADVCLEGGESLQATQHLKKAYSRFNSEKDKIDSFSREKLRALGDPVLGKFLLEQAIKRRELDWACDAMEELQDRTIRELLQRARTKKQTLNSAARGGHALKSELVLNVLSEALLCLRLGRMKESVRSFIQILDDKPVENEVLEPFFCGLEKKYPKAGRIRLAYACTLIYAQQYDKAMSRLVQAVTIEPKLAEDALERLRNLSETFENPPDSLQDALVEILLAKGDILRAGEILQESLSGNPEKAKKVMELMAPYIEDLSDSLVLHYLFMDAALLSEQTRKVLELLKKISQSDDHRDDGYQWLETKSKEQFLSADIMLFHGRQALERGDAVRGLEIFNAIAGSSPNDLPTALTIVEKHKDLDEKLADFLDEHKTEQPVETGHSDDGLDFEHFENNEFQFSGTPAPQPADEPGAEPEDKPKPDIGKVELDPGPFAGERNPLDHDEAGDETNEEIKDGAENQKPGPPEEGLMRAAAAAVKGQSEEIVWEEEDDDGVVESSEEPATKASDDDDESWLLTQNDAIMGDPNAEEPPAETLDEDQDELPAAVDDSPREASEPETPQLDVPEQPEQPDYDIDEEHARNLAEALRDGGAKLFFHIDDDSSDPRESGVEAVAEEAGEAFVESEPEAAPPREEVEEPDAEDERAGAEEPAEIPAASTMEELHEEWVDEPDEEPKEAAVQEPNPDVETESIEPVSQLESDHVAAAEESTPEAVEEPGDSFEADFQKSISNELDNESALAAAVEALKRGLFDEARELLHFEPRDGREDFERRRCLIDYYMAIDRSSPALAIIESIDTAGIDDNDHREILMKKAACHKQMHDFERAHDTYTVIMRKFPSSEVNKMAKRNYRRYLQSQCDEVLVLEKTTSIDGE